MEALESHGIEPLTFWKRKTEPYCLNYRPAHLFNHVVSKLAIFDHHVKMYIYIFVAAKQQKDLCGHPLLHSYFGIAQTA